MTAAPVQPAPRSDILPVTIEEEMQRSYLDYAMSVIVSRALPDVRDGLKPVHRRIIFTMKEKGYDYNRPYRKSARIVGDVMGQYHPHGDAAIYDALVRMVQTFSMRLPLIDGQGNFGSMDGDPPAAMRYTEARLARSAHSLIEDIDQKTVDFQPNYDGTAEEPIVLPARFPNLLVNGAEGIAVGMATKIAPHNLGEIVDACIAYIDNPAITVDEMIEKYVPGPDFPTAGIIMGRSGVVSALRFGRGTIIMRGRAEIEEIRKEREAIVITEIPYQVNKARMIEIIAEHVRDKRIDGISDLRDESDRRGLRVVVEIKREADAGVVLNQLYAYSPLQTSFGVNMLALSGGRPLTMNLKEVIAAFIEFREEVVRRRTIFELERARERAHILVGLAVAVANLDDVIKLIRAAPDAAQARADLLARAWPAADVAPLVALIDEPGRKIEDGRYRLSDAQARAILDMRLQRLTGLERDKIADDLKVLGKEIEGHLTILSSRQRLLEVMKAELVKVKDEFATPRRTAIVDEEITTDIEDIIQREDMIVTVTNTGYIKRVPLSAYRTQRRGGKGRAGMSVRDEDFVSRVFVANTHTSVLFFSSAGKVYKLKVYELPLGTPQARGKALVNLLPLKEGETISTVMPLPDDESGAGERFVMFATASGNVRRNRLSDFVHVMSNGKIAMKLDLGDRLVDVHPCAEDEDVLLAARSGKCIRFPVPGVRVFSGRSSDGVRGIRLGKNDRVISMSVLRHAKAQVEKREEYLQAVAASRRLKSGDYENRAEDRERDKALAARLKEPEFQGMAAAEEFILSVTENGYGKRSSAYEYRITGRGGQGIANIETSARNGPVVASFPVGDGDHLVMVSNGGQIIRCRVADIRIAGRKTQGVTLFTLSDGETLVSVTRLAEDGDADDAAGPGGDGSANGGEPELGPETASDPEAGTKETPS